MNRRLMIIAVLGGATLLWGANPTVAATEEAQPPPLEAPAVAKFGADQLDQMVAPVALYPDSLLMQVMIASTYPLEVVEADRWLRKNASLKDDALDKALEQKDWDPSVEAMTHFPDLLKRMSENLDWTKDLGDAFLAQKDDILDAVQRMRRRAQEAGTLQTTKEQTVTKEVVNNKETIIVQPASPQVVYVPTYPPAVYGPTYAPPSPYYPTAYGYTGGQMATASLLSFGLGVGVGALISDGCNWGSNDVHVNNNYYGGGGGGGGGNNNSNNNINVNKNNTFNKNTANSNRQTWQHNPDHRRNVAYRDQKTSQKFESRNPSATRERQAQQQARGYDRGEGGGRGSQGAQARERGGGSQGAGAPQRGGGSQGAGAPQRGGGSQGARAPERGGGAGGSAKPATANRGGGGQAQARPASTTGGRQDAFQGSGNGRGARESSQRGASSRGTQSMAGGGGGTQRGAGHSGSGGGGGGRGGGGGGGGGRGGGGGGGGRGGGGGGGRRR